MDPTITPEGLAQLAQLNQLRVKHFEQKLLWQKVNARTRGNFDLAMQERHRARETFFRCFENITRKSETQAPSATVMSQGSPNKERARSCRIARLDELKTALLREQTFLHNEYDSSRSWQAGNARREHFFSGKQYDLVRKAVRLVLKFTGEIHDRRMARLLVMMERMLRLRTFPNNFPPELFEDIVQYYVWSQRYCWRVSRTDSLGAVADKTFAWPTGLQGSARTYIGQLAEVPLLQSAIIELPAHTVFPDNGGTLPIIPPAISGSKDHVRFLVLDLELNPKDLLPTSLSLPTRYPLGNQIPSICSKMQAFGQQFPNLTTCVLSILLDDVDNTLPLNWISNSAPLSISARNIVALKPSVVPLINSFGEHGPGEHKLVRFLYQRSERACAGPLIRLEYVQPTTMDLYRISPVDTQQAQLTPTNGALLFDRAFSARREINVRGRV